MPNPINPSDEELVHLAQMGKQDAFTQLYERYLRSVYGRVRMKVPAEDVEDLTQEVFIAVMKSLNQFQGRSKFKTWVWTLTSRKIADYYRSRKSKHLAQDINNHIQDSSLITQIKEPDELVIVQAAMRRLPENYQEVILLRFIEEYPFDEIARLNGQSLEAVKSLFRRAMEALRKEMGAAHE